jgi:hypothetical protein
VPRDSDTSSRSGRSGSSGRGGPPRVPRVPRAQVGPDQATDVLLGQARSAGSVLAHGRSEARTAAARAIYALEQALVEALQGQALRGLKNLGQGNAPFYAARVRGEPDTKLAWPAEPESVAESLCILPGGQLAMVACATDDRAACLDPVTRPVTENDLLAEDVEALALKLATILPRHIAAAERARERYAKLHALAERVEQILNP